MLTNILEEEECSSSSDTSFISLSKLNLDQSFSLSPIPVASIKPPKQKQCNLQTQVETEFAIEQEAFFLERREKGKKKGNRRESIAFFRDLKNGKLRYN